MNLFYILRLNTSYIIPNDKFIDLDFNDAQKKGLVISLGDNQLLRFIRRIKENEFNKEFVDSLNREKSELKKDKNNKSNSRKIIKIQNQINELLFVPDLISIRTDTSKQDYKDLCKNGLRVRIKINNKVYDMKYKRLCAGAGQLRRNSAMFVNQDIYDMLETIMMCGLTKNSIGKINLAKFNAYYALYTSAANPVRKPRICVVDDLEIDIKNQKIAWIYQNENGNMDIENRVINITQNVFDGSGMISPEMAAKWQEDLSLDYLPSSFIIRAPWIKGLVSVFDFHRFAKEIAHTDKIVDHWGVEYNVDDIDIILTSSQFKLMKKYQNWQHYMYYHNKYEHIFSVARVNKRENDFLTTLNYQYIQSNNFTNESIKNLADFTIDWLKQIMTCDKLYTMLYLIGCHNEDSKISDIENKVNSNMYKVLMYDDRIMNDEYFRIKTCQSIDKKIKQAKIGKLFVEGSYDFAIPDLYALCEHAFGMEVNGLLKQKESWNKRWVDKGSTVVSMQRSPLVAPSENQLRYISLDEKCKDWFQYIQSGMIMSIWDVGMMLCSDADFDKFCPLVNL